jgi:hypothetical protein
MDTDAPRFVFASPDAPRFVWWPVTVAVPQDGGTAAAQSFEARFRVFADADFEIAQTAGRALQSANPRSALFGAFEVIALLRHAVSDVRGLENESGLNGPALIEALIATPIVREALLTAWRAMTEKRLTKN